ncbi:hypothetical protein [Methanobrevibacter boviskoreani]|uniref:hypothetical protein n=1 Tax=Methanobrevibacter boviskoreani TaxID=1348249 RepID=UPI0005946080|nr:hypothetical protein [Methanobrevibacter boviskoreani]MDD6256045.1 hypothetical protein [Methanobrevibacter boviskoreani]
MIPEHIKKNILTTDPGVFNDKPIFDLTRRYDNGELTDEEFLEDLKEISRLSRQAVEIFKKKKKLNDEDQD